MHWAQTGSLKWVPVAWGYLQDTRGPPSHLSFCDTALNWTHWRILLLSMQTAHITLIFIIVEVGVIIGQAFACSICPQCHFGKTNSQRPLSDAVWPLCTHCSETLSWEGSLSLPSEPLLTCFFRILPGVSVPVMKWVPWPFPPFLCNG